MADMMPLIHTETAPDGGRNFGDLFGSQGASALDTSGPSLPTIYYKLIYI